MKRVQTSKLEEKALAATHQTIADLQAEWQKARPRTRDVIYKNFRAALLGARSGRRSGQGERDILRLYYGAWVESQIRPTVWAARQELFGAHDPPFSHWRDALRWLGSEADLPFHEAVRVMEKARDTHHILGLPEETTISPLSFIYGPLGDPDAWTFLYFTTRSKLAVLHKWMELVSHRTGWDETTTLVHILQGSYILPEASNLINPLSFDDFPYVDVRIALWEIPNELRNHPTGRSPLADLLRDAELEPPHPLDAQLLLLMKSERYPPPSQGKGRTTGQGEYWRFMGQQWRKTYGAKMEPWALRKRWERMDEDLRRSLCGPRPLLGL
jgi:hypothetical protein